MRSSMPQACAGWHASSSSNLRTRSADTMRTSVPLRSVGTPTAPPPGPVLSARSMRSEIAQAALPPAPRRACTPPPRQLTADGRHWLAGPVVRRQPSRDTPRQVHVEAMPTSVQQPVTRTQSSSTNLAGQAACRAATLATYGQLPVLEESSPCPTLASTTNVAESLETEAPARPLQMPPQWTTAVVARDLSERILRKTLPAVPVPAASCSTSIGAGADTPTTEDRSCDVVLPETPLLDKSAVIVRDGVRCNGLRSCLTPRENTQAQPVGVTLLHDASTQTPSLPSMMARLDIEVPLAALLSNADSWQAPITTHRMPQVGVPGSDRHEDEDKQRPHGVSCRVHRMELRVAPTRSDRISSSERLMQEGHSVLVDDPVCATPAERPQQPVERLGGLQAQDHSLQLSPLTPSLFSAMSASHSTVSTLPSPLLKEGALTQLDLERVAADEFDALPTFRAQGESHADENGNKRSPTRTPLLGALRKRAASLSQRLLRKERQCQALQEALSRCHRSMETAGQWEVLNASLRSTAEGSGTMRVPTAKSEMTDSIPNVYVVANEAGLNRALWPSSHTAEPDAPARVQSNSATPDKKMVPQKAVPRRPLAACENICV